MKGKALIAFGVACMYSMVSYTIYDIYSDIKNKDYSVPLKIEDVPLTKIEPSLIGKGGREVILSDKKRQEILEKALSNPEKYIAEKKANAWFHIYLLSMGLLLGTLGGGLCITASKSRRKPSLG